MIVECDSDEEAPNCPVRGGARPGTRRHRLSRQPASGRRDLEQDHG